jgi:D-isomer specific 2-hydroxyacid dehydrogenase-like protein
LHPESEGLFDDELIGKMKYGAYLVNAARGKICDRETVVRALESGPALRSRPRRATRRESARSWSAGSTAAGSARST